MFTPVVPFLDPYPILIESDRISSHFVKVSDDCDSALEYDDGSDVIFDLDYDYDY